MWIMGRMMIKWLLVLVLLSGCTTFVNVRIHITRDNHKKSPAADTTKIQKYKSTEMQK